MSQTGYQAGLVRRAAYPLRWEPARVYRARSRARAGKRVTDAVEVFRRPEHGLWLHEEASAGGTITIAGREICVDDIYRRAAEG